MIDVNPSMPIPAVRRPRESKYPWGSLEIGEFFFLPDRPANNMTVLASRTGRKLGKKFRTRLTTMRETIEGWQPCEEFKTGAVWGVGVWRDL